MDPDRTIVNASVLYRCPHKLEASQAGTGMEINLRSINEMLPNILSTDINRSQHAVDRYFTEVRRDTTQSLWTARGR